ncbi:universal stress protein [Stenotrophomonas indicatrix]|uniref:universal stress protein n=1 Tax=Stenotrophomonas indicatrix TaxID=2045451 RepID=UPI0013DBECB5|nr:universal stress protein [Stenotrophomonas indicatrix]
MIKDLFLPMTGAPGDDAALAAAVQLASGFNAHLAVLEMVNLPLTLANPWGFPPEPSVLALHEELRKAGQQNASRLRTYLEKEGISWEVRLDEALAEDPTHIAALHARFSDVACVAAPPQGDRDSGLLREYFHALLFESGRPVLAVPAHAVVQAPPSHIVIAWHPTEEASRALNDALPFMTAATTVDVVHVTGNEGKREERERIGLDIGIHLARHGIEVNVVSRPPVAESVALSLLRHARASGAQLIVAGGYGHSRAREWLLGGVTRELLHTSHLPVLFAH